MSLLTEWVIPFVGEVKMSQLSRLRPSSIPPFNNKTPLFMGWKFLELKASVTSVVELELAELMYSRVEKI